MIVAAVFIAAYAWYIIGDLHGTAGEIAQVVIWGSWGLFAVDFLIKLVLAENRGRWFLGHLIDFFLVALPFLQPLRLLRVFTLFAVMQRIFGKALRGRIAIYVIGSSMLLVFLSALAVLEAERPAPHSKITNFGDAIWWACETVTTVGFGDFVPVTIEGRVVAVGLMVCGLALVGVIAATLASWLIAQVSIVEEVEAQETRAELTELIEMVGALRLELAQLKVANPSAPEGSPPGRS